MIKAEDLKAGQVWKADDKKGFEIYQLDNEWCGIEHFNKRRAVHVIENLVRIINTKNYKLQP